MRGEAAVFEALCLAHAAMSSAGVAGCVPSNGENASGSPNGRLWSHLVMLSSCSQPASRLQSLMQTALSYPNGIQGSSRVAGLWAAFAW